MSRKLRLIGIVIFIIILCFMYIKMSKKLIVYMNGVPISKVLIDDKIYIFLDELSDYGFDYKIKDGRVHIYENPIKKINTLSKSKNKNKEIGEYIQDNNILIPYTQFGGRNIILAKDLSILNCSYYERLNEDDTKSVFINSTINHLVTTNKNERIQLKFKDKDIYSGSLKIGIINDDNIEMIELKKTLTKLGYFIEKIEKIDSGYKILIKKADYEIKLNLLNSENTYEVYLKGSYMHKNPISQKAIFEDNNIYMSTKDMQDIFDFKIIRNFDLKLEKNDFGYGNNSNIGNYVYEDGWIYFVDSTKGGIWRFAPDNKNLTNIINGEIDELKSSNGKLYYVLKNDGLYNFDIKRNIKTKLINGNLKNIMIDEDYLYFSDIDSKALFKLNLITNDKIKLDDVIARDLIKIEDRLIFINELNFNNIEIFEEKIKLRRKISSIKSQNINSDGEKIYSYTNDGLYSMNIDGSNEVLIFTDKKNRSKSILIYGEKIYWEENGEIFSVNKNGSNYIKEYQIPPKWNDAELVLYKNNIIIIGLKIENIIYQINKNNIFEIERLGDIKDIKGINGKEVYYEAKNNNIYLKRIDQPNAFEISNEIKEIYGVVEDWIYYYKFVNDKNKSGLYKMKKDRSNKEMLIDYNFKMPQIDYDGIYFIQSDYGSMGDLYKVPLNEIEKELIIKNSNKNFEMQYELYDKYILFTQRDGIYMKEKNTQKTYKIISVSNDIKDFKVYNDKIYYIVNNKLYQSYLKPSSKSKSIKDNVNEIIYIFNNDIFYKNNEMKIECLNSNNEIQKNISILNLKSVVFLDEDNIYAVDENNNLFQISKKNKEFQNLGEFYFRAYTNDKDSIYYSKEKLEYGVLEMQKLY